MIEAAKDWPRILQFGTGDTITEAEVEKRYRQVAKKAHPDAGGSNEAMTQVNLAKELALRWVAKERDRISALSVVEPGPIHKQWYAEAEAAMQQQGWANQSQYANAAQQQSNAQGWANSAYAQQSGAGFGNYVNAAEGQSKASWVRNFFRSAR
jgi:curved DNA-binding protein CbpA